uniref:BMERB domain-containing protein n=1 Tax=Tanacetum cinerariifolium TaxID=118510 RepID=A0A699JZB2_TANCI|nr:hypothetical protein [Tanacetum cinerariifolium]
MSLSTAVFSLYCWMKLCTASIIVDAAELRKVTPLFNSILVQNQAPEGEGSAIPTPQPTPFTSQPNISAIQTAPHPTVSHEPQTETYIKQILPSLSTYQRKHRKTHKPRKAKNVTKLPQTSVPLDIKADGVVHQEGSNSVERAITTDASLVAAQDSDNIAKTQSTAMGVDAQIRFKTASTRSSDPPLSTGHTVGSGEDRMEQETNLTDIVPPTPHDSPLSGGHTPGSDEGRPNINELMNLCTQLSNTKKTLDKENVFKLGRDESNKIEELNLSDKGSGKTKVFDYTTAAKKDVNANEPVFTVGDAVNVAGVIPDVSAAGPSTSTAEDIFKDERTSMVDTLMDIRRTRPRTTSIVIYDVEEEPRRATPPPTIQSRDKEIAQRLFEEEQAQFEREQRIARGKAIEQEAKDVALIKQMEDVHARIDADALLIEILEQEEREQFTIDEQSRMLVDLIAERKRFFAAQRAKQIRNKPPTKA